MEIWSSRANKVKINASFPWKGVKILNVHPSYYETAPQCPECREANNWFALMGVKLALFPVIHTPWTEAYLDNSIGLFWKSWLFLKWLLYNWSMIIEEILLGFQSSKLRSTVYRTQFLRGKKLFLYKLFLLMCCCKQQMHDMPGPAKLSELFDRRSLSAPPSPILQREG